MGFNSGGLFSGRRGTGKTGVLLMVTMWAHKAGWVVVSMPSCFDITKGEEEVTRHHDSGL